MTEFELVLVVEEIQPPADKPWEPIEFRASVTVSSFLTPEVLLKAEAPQLIRPSRCCQPGQADTCRPRPHPDDPLVHLEAV